MNVIIAAILCTSLAAGSIIKLQIPSGSVAVSKNGAVVAGPAGSVATDNGLWGDGAGTRISGPAGDVRTRGGKTVLTGPGNGGDGWCCDGDDGNDGKWNNGGWGGDNDGDDGSWGGDNDGEDDGQWRGDAQILVAPVAVGWNKW